MTPEEFTLYMRSTPSALGAEAEPMREAYRYAKVDISYTIIFFHRINSGHQSKRFVMRSQLDCHDSRLPGTGVFDIKTRACLPIRLDLLNFEVQHSAPLLTT
jgi:Mitochondrial protein Pet127